MTQLQLFEGKMFGSIGLHAALVLNRLRNRAQITSPMNDEHQEDRERQTGRQREDEQQPENQVDGVEGDLNKRPAT
jgi:hypothetical protein